MLLTPNKPPLSEAFARIMATRELLESPDKAEFCILDDGSLIHPISWEKGVFDGYTAPSVKDATHHNRSNGTVGPKVIFTATSPWQFKKKIFLSNLQNKQNFINLLNRKPR